MQGVEAEEIGPRGAGGSGASGGPGEGGPIVAGEPSSAFRNGVRCQLNERMFVRQSPRKFQVRNGNGAAAIVTGDQRLLDGARKERAPDNRCRVGAEPDAAHTALAGVAGAVGQGGANRNQFAKPGGSISKRVGDGTEIGEAVKDVASEAHTVAVTLAEGVLENGEQAAGAWQGSGHRLQLSKELMPLGNGNVSSRRGKGIEECVETGESMRWKVQRA